MAARQRRDRNDPQRSGRSVQRPSQVSRQRQAEPRHLTDDQVFALERGTKRRLSDVLLHIIATTNPICNACVAKAVSVALGKLLSLTLSATCQDAARLDAFMVTLRMQVDLEIAARNRQPSEVVH